MATESEGLLLGGAVPLILVSTWSNKKEGS